MGQKYFKTGDIAKFSNVSTDTVRYYDKANVVSPTLVEDNGYRYYTFGDALKFNESTLLRELNVSLLRLKEYLFASNSTDIRSFHEEHMANLKEDKMLLDRKIHYLARFDEIIKGFETHPNELEYFENESIYMCKSLRFHVDKHGFHLEDPVYEDNVDDTFWSRTSVLGFVNKLEHVDSPEMGYACCFNIISGDYYDIEALYFSRVLRFNYIGDPFSDTEYLKDIYSKVSKYCSQHNLTLSDTFYQIYFLCQSTSENHLYFIQIYFPCDSGT